MPVEKLWQIVAAVCRSGGHDISHIQRVYRLTKRLSAGREHELDLDVLFSAAILHDIARQEEDNDPAGVIDHALLGAEKAEQMLLDLGWSAERAAAVAACIATHRYRSESNRPVSPEAQILYDADKLDCLGAVGIGRLFLLSGVYGEQFYIDPPPGVADGNRKRRIHTYEEYSPNMEYEIKMRFIPDTLFTEEAKAIAAGRMERMDRFFADLKAEIDGLM